MRRTLVVVAGLVAGSAPLSAEDAAQRISKLGCQEIARAPVPKPGQDGQVLGMRLPEWTPALLEALGRRVKECGAATQVDLARDTQVADAEEKAKADRVRAVEQRAAAAKAAYDKAEAELADARLILGRAAAEVADRNAQRERRARFEDAQREAFETALRQQVDAERRSALARAAEIEQKAEREAVAARESASRQRADIERQRGEAETRRVEAERQVMEARAAEAKLRAMEEAAKRQEAELLPLQIKAVEARKRVEAALETLVRRTREGGKRP